ncbi:MAG: beta-ketoacyl synthase [Porticoccaceae bacterium]|nr:beta-ketoacyl synthase [Porticoccaceae bacterium]
MAVSLPLIVGFGGYNAAGRSSSHQAFRRMILESLSPSQQQATIVSLACLMALVKKHDQDFMTADAQILSAAQVDEQFRATVLSGTLVRKITSFDPSAVSGNKKINLNAEQGSQPVFTIAKRDLPSHLPEHWQMTDLDNGTVEVRLTADSDFLVNSDYELAAKAAGELPDGFNPADHYNARFHPRTLQMALIGASDALHSVGIPWQKIADAVNPDQIGVYSSSGFSQMSDEGFGGLLQARLKGGRTTAKQVPMGLNSMPADFINAYVLGSVGHTEAITGACATFLYCLQAAVRDIRSGARRVAIVGNAEAVVMPEVSEGFSNMSALGSDANLCKLDATDTPDWRRASRPFGHNCGFTLAEATQYLVLMDDALAVELGADIQAAVPEVFINADGVKKSISAPGIGNTISFSKAVAAAINIVGKQTVQKHSFVHAHGSSTPANRTTESELINRVADAFDIRDWPVTAVKSYVGHTISAASGDQLMSAMGTFKYQIIPGIKTITEIAEDVNQQRTLFPLQDMDVSDNKMQVAFINSKGFGGNNATAVLLAPQQVEIMLTARYAEQQLDAYRAKRAVTRAEAERYADRADRAELDVIYRFGEELVDEDKVVITEQGISVPSFARDIEFDLQNPYSDMK